MPQRKSSVTPPYLKLTARLIKKAKRRSHALMKTQPGHRVLDVGCGPGTDTIALAKHTGQTGLVFGVDHDESMIADANRESMVKGLCDRVQHIYADATELPFAKQMFDSTRSDHLFQHLFHPEEALAEMVRVTRKEGWIVVLDTDWGTVSIDTTEIEIERKLARVHAELSVNNGYSGRQLYRLFQQQNLADLVVDTFSFPMLGYENLRLLLRLDKTESDALSAGVISSEDLKRWLASMQRMSEKGVLFSCGTVVLVAGQKQA